MPLVAYASDVPPAVQRRVRRRYAADFRQLASLGFADFIYYSEIMKARPMSVAMLVLMVLRREVVFRHEGLRFGASYLLMQHDGPFAVALPMGMGVKFYTAFTDGSLLIASSFPSEAIPYDGRSVQKYTDNTSLEAAWHAHCVRVEDAVSAGKTTRRVTTFDEFVELSLQEEAALAERFPYLSN